MCLLRPCPCPSVPLPEKLVRIVQQAQAALDLYSQRLQLLTQNYELRQNREQYLYQQERDRIADQQWQKSFDEQVRQNEIENQWRQKEFDYQQQRDAVADSQWQQQFNLSKKKSSSGSSSKKKSSSSSGNLSVSGSNGYEDSYAKAYDYLQEIINVPKNVYNQAVKLLGGG